MVFSSLIFLFVFFTANLIVYFAVSPQKRNKVLLIFSLVFYAWGGPRYLLLLAGETLVSWIFALKISEARAGYTKRTEKFYLVCDLVIMLACLAVFKYLGFFIGNFKAIFGVPKAVPQIVLPIGISFYTFQLISYVVDVYRNQVKPQKEYWRYDPIFFSDRYTKEYHLKAFKSIAEALSGYTEKCVISFVDIYPKNKKNMDGLSSYELNDDELLEFAEKLSKIAADNNIKIGSCAEKIDLDECGIIHNCCIDRELIEKIIGCKLNVGKDKNQRKECGCVESVEIGTYNTCKNGCAYCYANYSSKSVETNAAKYDPSSPLLCGQVQEDDKITIRKVESLKETQLSIFDM